MADVLGKHSFLETPDVNGDPVLLSTNPVALGSESLTLPAGTTAQRPVTPIAGMSRFNTTTGLFEYYTGSVWNDAGGQQTGIIQTVIGNISSASSNSQIPYDNTVPQITEGYQLWSQSFTPLSASSIIIITTSAFYAVSTNSDVHTTIAYFNGNTSAVFAQLCGFSTSNSEGKSFSAITTLASASTTARTYSCRIGPNINATVYYCRGSSGQAYGGTTNSGRYIIQEILV